MKSPIVVFGMHRSGTSFMIRALNLCGLWIGKEEELYTVAGRAGVGNPKGNYEHLGAVKINDAILACSGGSWRSPPQSLTVSPTHVQQMREFLASLRSQRPAASGPCGFKDPRTVLAYDAWRQTLPRSAFLIAMFRHPRLVASSLSARDGMTIADGYALWAAYNRRLLAHLQDSPSLLLRFDVSESQLISQVTIACEHIGLRPDLTRLAEWYDRSLVRQTLVGADESALFEEVAPVWKQLLAYFWKQPGVSRISTHRPVNSDRQGSP
jgi:hypothetical protein